MDESLRPFRLGALFYSDAKSDTACKSTHNRAEPVVPGNDETHEFGGTGSGLAARTGMQSLVSSAF